MDCKRVAALAKADEFIEAREDGYQHQLTERGGNLSVGEKQLLSIARAMARDTPIVILDEATAAVDNETEAAIQRSLMHITKNRTTVVIAHRLSTVRHADQIIVMDQGNIVEQGTHDSLLKQSGIYRDLWRVQAGLRTDELLLV